jgi:predicted transcriptional regulator
MDDRTPPKADLQTAAWTPEPMAWLREGEEAIARGEFITHQELARTLRAWWPVDRGA